MIGAFSKRNIHQSWMGSRKQSAVANLLNQQSYKQANGGSVAHSLNQANAQAQLAAMGWSTSSNAAGGTGPTNYYITTNTSGSSTTTTTTSNGNTFGYMLDEGFALAVRNRAMRIADGQEVELELPDGTTVEVKADGSYVINDKHAKIVYRANKARDFNSYVNASDKLEDFIRYCGQHGVRKDDMLQLPVRLFIAWLVVEAAKADQEAEPEVALIPDLRKAAVPRCVGCGHFIRHELVRKQIVYCTLKCFERVYVREAKLLEAA